MATVLVVDDVPEVLAIVSLALSRDGHVVLQAADTDAAVRVCAREGARIDLAVVDAGLCNRGGFADEIRRRIAGGTLLIMSGFPLEMLKCGGALADCSADRFLQKPFRPEQLRSAVRLLVQGGARAVSAGC